MTESRQSFRFEGLASRPVPSILREFSAPVVLDRQASAQEQAFLLAHDTDPFNKWEAGRALARNVLLAMITKGEEPASDWLQALAQVALDETLAPDFRALALRLPGDDELAQALQTQGTVPDPDAIHQARRQAIQALAGALGPRLPGLVSAMTDHGAFSPDAVSAGKRALKGACLGLQTRLDGGKAAALAFASATNMTDQTAALSALLDIGKGQSELAAFETRWMSNALVMDKWFALQIGHAVPEKVAEVTAALTGHPAFTWKNPNRFRSVIGALSANHAGFHRADGSGYRLLADWLIRMDAVNPQTAARMSTAFETWPRYDATRQAAAKAQLGRILGSKGLSRDLGEMVGRLIAAGQAATKA
jgi:aminopeptidase N